MAKGLLFDFDGTLYGDWRLWVAVIQETLRDFEVQVSPFDALEKGRAMISDGSFVNISGVAIAMARDRSVMRDPEIRASFLEKLDKVMDETGPSKELLAILEIFRNQGVRFGIVSFMREARLLRRLELWKLTEYFGSIVTPEQLPEFKPSPQPFLAAMQELWLLPADSYVIGDEPVDMIGGKKAGARTIGVPQGFYSGEELSKAGADFIAESLAALPSLVH